jgi:hypothetical protein
MAKETDEIDVFSPYDIFENLKKNNLDPSIFDTIDERDFPKAPNFLEFAIGPQFLNTLILPKQVEIGTKLFCDYCPRCSKEGYVDRLFDQSVGNIKDNIVFLEHGVCPKCKVNRFELIKSKELIFRNELVGVAGQRCISVDAIVLTSTGLKTMGDVNVGDILTHGVVSEVFDSGKRPSLKLTTMYGHALVGSKETHIVPVLRFQHGQYFIENIYMKDCIVGDFLLMNEPDKFGINIPEEVRPIYIQHGIVGYEYFPVPIIKIEDGPELLMKDVTIPDTNLYTADGFVHHNSGKTKLVGLLAAYVNHRFLKIPSPIRTFNQTSGDMLAGTFSALSADHSFRNLWQAFKGFMDGSPWFQNYHRFIKGEEKRLGVELLHELKASIFYGHKHLMWSATGSQDRKMRGDTRIFAAIDELGWMISDEQKADLQNMNADAIYTALSNSLTTMRTKFNRVYNAENFDLPPIFMCNISSPSSVKDKIMRLSKEAKRNDRIFAIQCASWEMNPDYTYEALREEMSHIDELTFARDFGAEPPLASNPFIPEPRLIDKIATGEPFTSFTCTEYQEKDFLGDYFKSVKLNITKPDKVIPRLVSFDLGSMKNSLAVCLFSLTSDLKPKLDFAFAVRPTNKIRANIARFFEDFTVTLVTHFSIKHAFFDRWQSLDQIERLKGMGVNAQVHSVTYKEMDSIRGSILSQSIIMPKLEHTMDKYVREYIEDIQHIDALALLGLQFLTVRDMGHKMAKPLLGDDDVFRAFVLGATMLSDPKVKEEYLKQGVEIKTGQTVAYLGTVRLRSAGGGMGTGGAVEGEKGKMLGTIKSRRGMGR